MMAGNLSIRELIVSGGRGTTNIPINDTSA